MTSLWRQAFDAVERPVAAASESWVQSKTFMDLAAVTIRVQRRLTADGQRMAEQWLHAWGMPARGDLFRLMNQVAGLERQVRDLERELQLHNGRPPANQPGPPAPRRDDNGRPSANQPRPAAPRRRDSGRRPANQPGSAAPRRRAEET